MLSRNLGRELTRRLSVVSSLRSICVGALFLCALGGKPQSAGPSTPVIVSSSTATGVGLAAAAAYKVSTDNQWKDYEDVVIIATLNGAAKASPTAAHTLTTADYNSLAAQLRTQLDLNKPQGVIQANTQSLWLRYAIDALMPLSASSQAGPVLPVVLGDLENTKFAELEGPLDPNRQYPADLDLSAVETRAQQFVENQIEEANDLALNDPQYALALNVILQDLTGVDTTTAYSGIQQLFPYATPALPPPNADGSFTVNPQDLVAQYESIITFAQCGLDNALGALESSQSTPADCVAAASAHVQSESSARGRRAATTVSPVANCSNNKPPDSKTNPSGVCWSDASSAIDGLQKLVSLSDPQLATEISTVGGAVTKAGAAIDVLSGVDSLTVIGALGEVGTIAGAAETIFSLFNGSSSNANAAVLAQIQKLSQQIARMQADMDAQFAKVDDLLNTVLKSLNSNFALIDYQLGTLSGDAHAIQETLLDVQAQISRLEQYTLAYSQASSKEGLITEMNGCLDYAAVHNGADIGDSMYASCENDFYSWAHDTALDELWAGLQQPDYTDPNIYNTFINFPMSVNVNYLAQFPAQNLSLSPLSNARVPNPNEWTLGARSYLELAHQWPRYASQINSSRIDDLIRAGTNLLQAGENANSINNAGILSANQPLFNALTGKANAALSSLQNSIVSKGGIVDQFVSNPSLKLGWTPPGGVYSVNLNLWGGPSQTSNNAYVPAAFSASSLPDCNGGAAWVMAPNLVSAVSLLVRNAEQLGLGATSLCLNFSWYWAGTSWTNDPYGNAPGDYALGSYQIQARQAGNVVFAETIFGYSQTDPAHQILECMGRPPLRSGNTEIWSQAGCEDEYSISFAYYSITTNPIGSACQTLANAVSGPSPRIWNLSPQFAQFVNQNGGLYVCVPGAPLANLFAGNSLQTIDPSSGLNVLSAGITATFASDQQALYGDIAGALCDPSSGCTASGPFSGQLSAGTRSLTGTKMLLQAYASFGLPLSLRNDNVLHSLLYGDQSILDSTAMLQDFVNFGTNSVADVTDNKISDEFAGGASRVSTLLTALTTDLNQIQQTQTPEYLNEISLTLEDLKSFEVLKGASSLSLCAYELSTNSATIGEQGSLGTITVQASSGCAWSVSTASSWLTSLTPNGTGSGTLTYYVPANSSPSPRDGILIIGNQVFSVTQAGTGSGGGGGGGGGGGTSPDFSLSANIGSQALTAGASAAFQVTANALNGFTGTVGFTVAGLPPGALGTFSPQVLSGAAGSTELSVSTTPATLAGSYPFVVTGTAGSISHYAEGELVVHGDISGSMSSSEATISVGKSGTFTLTLSSIGGLTDSFAFSCPGAPQGLSCSFSPTSATLPPNGTVNAQLTVTVNSKPSSAAISRLPSYRWPGETRALESRLFVISAVCLISLVRSRSRRRGQLLAGILIVILGTLCVGAMGSCGSGPSSSNTSSPPSSNQVQVNLSIQASSPSITKSVGTVTITVP